MISLVFRSIGFIILAIISIGLLLALMGGPVRDMANSVFCYVYKTFSPIVPGMEIPLYCETSSCYVKRETVSADSAGELATYIAAYAVNCYTQGGTTCHDRSNVSVCNELLIKKPFRITETDVTKVMEQDYEHGCLLLENSKVVVNGALKDYPGECGDEDKIVWLLEGGEKLVIISYDLKTKRIIIR
jgi:hypothetical protein